MPCGYSCGAYRSVGYRYIGCRSIGYGYTVCRSRFAFSKGPIGIPPGNGVVVWILNSCS